MSLPQDAGVGWSENAGEYEATGVDGNGGVSKKQKSEDTSQGFVED